ncbi:MAG: HAMP domain-containing protein [Desulfobacteraceae bacterium]|nr:HAMP domain-containing protein [Desulfobacteraceae bacterium]
MKENGFSHISRWLCFYLVSVAFLVAITFLIIYQDVSGLLITEFAQQMKTFAGSEDIPAATNRLSSAFRLRFFIIFSAAMVITGLFSILWFLIVRRKINQPLKVIQHAVSRLASGKLNETVQIGTSEEFDQIGCSINELASNLQELLLYVWKQTGVCMHNIEKIGENLDSCGSSSYTKVNSDRVQAAVEAIEGLRDMAKIYVFYDVHIEGEKVLAINEVGQKSKISNPSEKN